jgi:nucleotide-binding universal stress UspA family protein
MRTVLAGIDDSAAAGPVLSAAKAAATLLGAHIKAMHVRENGTDTARAAAGAARVECILCEGRPGDCLVEASRSADVLMLVLGARGMPGGRRPAGHTALDVVSAAAKPVLVVPPESRPGRVARILVPLDGTMVSAVTLADTIRFARHRHIDVIALHVHEPGELPAFEDHPQHESEAWGREFVARYCGLALEDVRLEVRVGSPGRHVVDVARDLDVDVIALGWSRRLERDRAAVVREALSHSQVPVLLVPAPADVGDDSRMQIFDAVEARA